MTYRFHVNDMFSAWNSNERHFCQKVSYLGFEPMTVNTVLPVRGGWHKMGSFWWLVGLFHLLVFIWREFLQVFRRWRWTLSICYLSISLISLTRLYCWSIYTIYFFLFTKEGPERSWAGGFPGKIALTWHRITPTAAKVTQNPCKL